MQYGGYGCNGCTGEVQQKKLIPKEHILALLTVNTPFNIELEFSLAAFHKRMFAWLLDLLFMLVYSYFMMLFIMGNLSNQRFQVDSLEKWTIVLVFVIVILPLLFYHLIFELLLNGRSPGKLIMGLKVMNREGASPALSQYVLRWMLCLPNYFMVFLLSIVNPGALVLVVIGVGIVSLPDVISIASSAKSQRLGDLAAGTVVVNIRHKMHIAETIYMELSEADYQPLFPQVLQLSDKDINGIRNLLNSKGNKEREDYMLRVAYRIEEVLHIKMNGAPQEFLQTLLKDYNYLTQTRA